MNILCLTGNIGKDAEIRYTPSGDPVCSFNFAFTSGFGEKKVTSWLNANVWGKRAETLYPMLLKGDRVGLVGELTNRPYIAKDGTKNYNLEMRVSDVTLLSAKSDTYTLPANATPSVATNDFEEFKDDIPF